MKKITKFFDVFTRCMIYAAMAVLCVVLTLVVINIVGRSMFHFAIGGINEIVRYGVFLSIALGLSRTGFNGGHVIVSMILDKLPKKVRGVVAGIELLLAAAVFFMSVYVCCQLIPDAMSSGLTTEVYKVPFTIIYAVLAFSLAVSGLIFVYQSAMAVYNGFAKKCEEKAE